MRTAQAAIWLSLTMGDYLGTKRRSPVASPYLDYTNGCSQGHPHHIEEMLQKYGGKVFLGGIMGVW